MEAAGISPSTGTNVAVRLRRTALKNEFCSTIDHISPSDVHITRGTEQFVITPGGRSFCVINISTAGRAVKGAPTIAAVLFSTRLDFVKWCGFAPAAAATKPRTFTAAACAVFKAAAAIPAKSSQVYPAASTGITSTAARSEKPSNELAEVTGDTTTAAAQRISSST